jgi:hypothetical protein
MSETVHILATVRKPEMLAAALLVFRTLRVGFPDNPVRVWGNALEPASAEAVARAGREVGGEFLNLAPTVHDHWIERLLAEESSPFWICDTDVVFFGAMTHDPAAAVSGRLEPSFREEWTKTIKAERLHTCVQYFNPALLRPQMRAWMGQFPAPWGATAQFPLVRQHFIPQRAGAVLFYDSTAGLWQAGLGKPFDDKQNAAFEHLHCGTYADLISPHLAGGGLQEVHQQIYDNPKLARGMRVEQDKYYKRQAVEN